MKLFNYQRLETYDAFRVVILHKGSVGDDIECSLVHTTFSTCPTYKALSYTWGRNRTTHRAIINGCKGAIQENLWDALCHLRSPYEERILWIDAICIDQCNIPERNHQVGHMRSIYDSAIGVVIWLGPSTKSSRIAMQWIEDSDWPGRSSLGIKERLGLVPWREIEAKQVQRWRALDKLCSRDYWERVWIVQEVVLAHKLTIHCGGDVVSWTGLQNLMKDYKLLYKPSSCRALSSRFISSMPFKLEQHRKQYHGTTGSSLAELISTTKDSKCSDPRDKIYGLLGLASDVQDSDIQIDYSGDLAVLEASLWRFYVADRSPAARMAGCAAFQGVLERTDPAFISTSAEMQETSQLVGRSTGVVRYVGRPWRDDANTEAFYYALKELQEQVVSVKQQWRVFENSLSEICEKSDCIDVWRGYTPSLNATSSSCSNLPITGSSINKWDKDSGDPLFTVQLLEAILGSCINWSLLVPNILDSAWDNNVLFMTELGQFGIAPHETSVGDEICQFENCDVSIICRRQPSDSSGGNNNIPRTLVGRALLCKRWDETKREDFPFSVLNGKAIRYRRDDDAVVRFGLSNDDLVWFSRRVKQ